MRKKLLIGGLSIVFLVVLAGLWFMSFIGEPMYRPGMVRAEMEIADSNPEPRTNHLQPGVKDSYWRVRDDIELYYETNGTGKPILVVHGGPGFTYPQPWKGLEKLSDSHQFYYYHQRGCGKSSKPFDAFESKNFYSNMVELESKLGLGAQIADIERIRKILNQETLTIIGHSFGGFIASLYAAEFPERVESLILVAPAGVLKLPNPEMDLFANARKRLPESDHKEYDRVHGELLDFQNLFNKNEQQLAATQRDIGKFLLKAMGDESPSPMQQDNGGWMSMAVYLSMGMSHDYSEALKNVRSPVLILHGENDELALAGSQTYAEAFPNAEFKTLKAPSEGTRAGHALYDDCPETFGQHVLDFLNR